MKRINEIATIKSVENYDCKITAPLDEQTMFVVNKLFQEFQSIFPSFRQTWKTNEEFQRAKRSWVKAFLVAGINKIEQLRFGLRRCRLEDRDFAVSSGKFIKWCTPTPEDLGIPSFKDAYHEACINSKPWVNSKLWSHDAVEHAAIETGLYNLSSMSSEKMEPLFNRNYEISIRMLVDGKTLKSIPKAIELKNTEQPENKIKMSRTEAMEKIRKSLGVR